MHQRDITLAASSDDSYLASSDHDRILRQDGLLPLLYWLRDLQESSWTNEPGTRGYELRPVINHLENFIENGPHRKLDR